MFVFQLIRAVLLQGIQGLVFSGDPVTLNFQSEFAEENSSARI
jgi:hypothetical protein